MAEEGSREAEAFEREQTDLTRTIRVAFKGFIVGGSLYTGLELVSAISSKRIFTRPGLTIANILSADLLRFSSFVGASCASYKLVTSVLQNWQQSNGRNVSKWWIPVAGGIAAGLASSIDEPVRRKTILLYLLARSIGALIKILNRRGFIPTVPHATALLFSIMEAAIILSVARSPALLPPLYYRAILHWSVYYTDEKLATYFRKQGPEFLPCSHSMHSGSCHTMALNDFKQSFSLYTRIYSTLYALPLVIFKLKEMLSAPQKTLKKYISNVLNSSLFFAIDGTLTKYLLCLLRNWTHQPPPVQAYIPLVSGFVGGLSIVLERPSRQLELVYYTAAQVLHILWKLLCIKKPLRLNEVPAGSVILYCLSLSVMMYSYVHEQEVLAPLIVKALNFIFQ